MKAVVKQHLGTGNDTGTVSHGNAEAIDDFIPLGLKEKGSKYRNVEGVAVGQLPQTHRLEVDSLQLERNSEVNKPGSEF